MHCHTAFFAPTAERSRCSAKSRSASSRSRAAAGSRSLQRFANGDVEMNTKQTTMLSNAEKRKKQTLQSIYSKSNEKRNNFVYEKMTSFAWNGVWRYTQFALCAALGPREREERQQSVVARSKHTNTNRDSANTDARVPISRPFVHIVSSRRLFTSKIRELFSLYSLVSTKTHSDFPLFARGKRNRQPANIY